MLHIHTLVHNVNGQWTEFLYFAHCSPTLKIQPLGSSELSVSLSATTPRLISKSSDPSMLELVCPSVRFIKGSVLQNILVLA
jgi:hypothetical protein